MVNLEEIMEEGKRFYVSPRMTIDEIDFADILTTSGGDDYTTPGNGGEGGTNDGVINLD